jgi:hypothetical protein
MTIRNGPLLTLTRLDGTTTTFHADRLFAIDTDVRNDEYEEVFKAVAVLRVVEEGKISLMPFKEDAEIVREEWTQALAWMGLCR